MVQEVISEDIGTSTHLLNRNKQSKQDKLTKIYSTYNSQVIIWG